MQAFIEQPERRFALPGARFHYAPDTRLLPIHVTINLQVEIEKEKAYGFVEYDIQAQVDGVRHLELDAVELRQLRVETPAGDELQSYYNGRKLFLEWKQPFQAGEQRKIVIHYQVDHPATGLDFSYPNQKTPEAPLFAVTDNETERARYWFPCVDAPNIRPTVEFFLRAPAELTILANGKLVEEKTHSDGTKTAHWRLDHPCPSYLTCFAIGDFTSYQDSSVDSIPVAYYAPKEFSPENLKLTFDNTPRMLQWLQEKLGQTYPFPKYYQFAARGIGGAMENISLVSWDDRFILTPDLKPEWKPLIDAINLHEMAHSYFGDAVVSYDFAHAWLKESWATYMEVVWLEDTEGSEAAAWQLWEDARAYFTESKQRYQRPIVTRFFNSSWQMYDRHLYPGGAWRLHMLRRQLGDDIFWTGVRKYLQRFQAQTVRTEDFQRILEEISGLNLQPFFDQWIYRSGHPKLKLKYSYLPEEKQARVELDQLQVEQDEAKEAFQFTLEIAWEVKPGEWVKTSAKVNRKHHLFTLDTAEAPLQVIVDPDQKLLAEMELEWPEPLLARMLENGPSLAARLRAVTALATPGNRQALEKLGQFLLTDSFWGLKLHLYRTLAPIPHAMVDELLARALAREQHPLVLEEAFRICGERRNPNIHQVIRQRLADSLPPRARAEALAQLGRLADDGDWNRLLQTLDHRDHRNWSRCGALRGLGYSRREAALSPLQQALTAPALYPEEWLAAVDGLGNLGLWLDAGGRRAVRESLEQALKHARLPVRLAAARALEKLHAKESIGALEKLEQSIPEQYKPEVQRVILNLSQPQPKQPWQTLTERVERLEKSLGRLANLLEELQAKLKGNE